MTAPVPCTRYSKNFLNTFPFSNYNLNMLLDANTALTYTIPGINTQKFRIKFTRNTASQIWVSYNKPTTDPTANTATINSYQELVPLEECRFVNGGDTLTFLSTSSNRISGSLLLLEDSTGM